MIEKDIATIIERIEALDAKVNQLMKIVKGEKSRKDDFILLKDASKMTGLSVKTLGNYCRSHKVEFTKTGGQLKIVRKSLEDYLYNNVSKTITEQVSEKVLNLN